MLRDAHFVRSFGTGRKDVALEGATHIACISSRQPRCRRGRASRKPESDRFLTAVSPVGGSTHAPSIHAPSIAVVRCRHCHRRRRACHGRRYRSELADRCRHRVPRRRHGHPPDPSGSSRGRYDARCPRLSAHARSVVVAGRRARAGCPPCRSAPSTRNSRGTGAGCEQSAADRPADRSAARRARGARRRDRVSQRAAQVRRAVR